MPRRPKRVSAEMAPKYQIRREGGVLVRRVVPYVYTFEMRCKERWLGRTVVDVLMNEYKANPPSYYALAIKDGRIRVNGEADRGSHTFRHGDVVTHITHRHEPPVDGRRIRIIGDDDEVFAVDKPPSMPMHPCGSYHYNTLSTILRTFDDDSFCGDLKPETRAVAQRGDLRQVHRLDRLTSGVVVFAKTATKARELSEAIGSGDATKLYLARVNGIFPVNAPLAKQTTSSRAATTRDESPAAAAGRANDDTWRLIDNEIIEVNAALACLNHKDGIYCCRRLSDDPTARPSRTLMKLLKTFDDATSLVLCRPLTGRTHQIRLHLQYLGHPISNDPCYGGVLTALNAFDPTNEVRPLQREDDGANDDDVQQRRPGETDASFAVRICRRCRFHVNEADAPHARFIWLHALRYSGPGWAFQSPLPDWAGSDDSDLLSRTIATAFDDDHAPPGVVTASRLLRDHDSIDQQQPPMKKSRGFFDGLWRWCLGAGSLVVGTSSSGSPGLASSDPM